jgi:DNA-directed RNA polymerase alpha subunit
VGTQNYGRFVISPLEKGYGTTLGNALRRVLLSSLDGVAVTSIRVGNVSHEFSTIPGVREDMMLFILNVKQIRFRIARPPVSALYAGASAESALDDTPVGAEGSIGASLDVAAVPSAPDRIGGALPIAGATVDAVSASDALLSPDESVGVPEGPLRLRLSISGQGPVTAGDIVCPPEIEVANPELYLLAVDDPDTELEIEMTVERGRGYSPSEERGKLPIGELPVDAIYSPIRRANFDVSPARVGQMTNYDSLVLEIWTDGTIRPQVALGYAAQLLIRHFSLFTGVETLVPEPEAALAAAEQPEEVPSRVADVPIEELDLSVRVYNCLKRTGITKVEEVLAKMEKGPDEMLAIRNFGSKSLDELVGKLEEKGYLEEGSFTW